MSPTNPHSKQLIVLATVIEGSLLLLSLFWAWLRGIELTFAVSIATSLTGILATAPLYGLAIALFLTGSRYLHSFRDFRSALLEPLALSLTPGQVIYISALAGLCEELFFRGVLLTEFGNVVSSALFALLHFGTAAIKFPTLVTLYFLISLYIGWIFNQTGSLWSVIFIHALYDGLAIFTVRILAPQKYA